MERDNSEKTKLYKKIVENLKKYEIDKKNKSCHHIGNSTVIISPDSRVLLTICLEGCKA